MENNKLLTIINNNICEKRKKGTKHIQPWEAYGNMLDLEKEYAHPWEAYENRICAPIKRQERILITKTLLKQFNDANSKI